MVLLGLDTPRKQGIFGAYVGLWITCHLLVFSSRREGAPSFNATSVVLLTEVVKLLLAVGLYLHHDGDWGQLWEAASDSRGKTLLLKYAVPALLYCVYNNLVYTNLGLFDPGTYNVLMQLRIVMTAIVYQVLFAKSLTRNQWLAILCITLGCMIKESGKFTGTGETQTNFAPWLLLLVQMLCSVLASVYNEVLLKGENKAEDGVRGGGITTNLQNAFMYFQSVLFNMLFLLVQGKLGEAVSPSNLQTVFAPTLLTVMAIMATVGMVTGFFLKNLNSVLKAVAGAFEVISVMVLSFFMFGTPLDFLSVLAALVVGAGLYLYALPVPEVDPASYTPVATDVPLDEAAKA